MIRVGITGGIGSGKTFVCKKIEALGFPVYFCDDEAKRLMVEDENIVKGLVGLIGSDSYIMNEEQNGIQLNKPVIAKYLFASSDNVQKVNSLVHPRVKADFLNWASRQKGKAVFMESAILFEAHFQDVVDRTILVTAPVDVRIERAMLRDHTSREQIESRMRQQQDGSAIASQVDYLVLNDGVADVDAQLRHILKLILE